MICGRPAGPSGINLFDPPADARRAMDAMVVGGIAILPNDVGYSLIGARREALARIFATKRRAPEKLNAMLGNDELHRELRVVSERGRKIVEAITLDYGLMKYHPWAASSTLLHCETLEVVRFGSCYENIAYVLKRHFGIELPPWKRA